MRRVKVAFQAFLDNLPACGNEYLLDAELEPCPVCGSAKVKVASGDQFFLDSIEVETSMEMGKNT